MEQVAAELADVSARRHLAAPQQVVVMADVALGDVRHRQVGDIALLDRVEFGQEVGQTEVGREHVGVVEHHALRRTGGARRVDNRQQLQRIRRIRCFVDVDGGTGQHVVVADGPGRVVAHDDDSTQARSVGGKHPLDVVTLFRHCRDRTAVADEIPDLLRRRGVVDADRGCTGEQGTEVGDVELDPVAQHDDDPVTRPHAECAQSAGELRCAIGVVPPGERRSIERSQRDGVRMAAQVPTKTVEHGAQIVGHAASSSSRSDAGHVTSHPAHCTA